MLLCFKEDISFRLSLSNTENVQRSRLLKMIGKNRNTIYGKKYGFNRISSILDFQKNVPITAFEDYIPYISLIENGAKNVLTTSNPHNIVPTSGSTSASKSIPYTADLKNDFISGIYPWIFNLFMNNMGLLGGKHYWSITPAGRGVNKKQKAPLSGFEDDSEYLGAAGKVICRHLFAVPNEVALIKDIDSFRYVTLLFLCAEGNLSFVSIWNPTFLILLMDKLDLYRDSIISDIRNGSINAPGNIDAGLKRSLGKKIIKDPVRADYLERISQQDSNRSLMRSGKKIWPRLSVISCWTEGNSAIYAEQLQRLFPEVKIEGKGLLATEAIVTFPYSGKEGCILSLRSHFFEFLEVEDQKDRGKIKLSHQLKIGEKYSVIVTTSGGLYRYRMFDIVEVVGFEKGCPRLKFIGKEEVVSDLFGEKVNALHVASILGKLFNEHSFIPSFLLVAPETDNASGISYYVLFIDPGDHDGKITDDLLKKLIIDFEKELSENYNYSYCRKLGQLSEARLFLVKTGSGKEAYNSACLAKGIKFGNIKSSFLDRSGGWSRAFDGRYLLYSRT
ncbi:MAG: GH3 auxin-responsive promoter family protein [Candidatus Omnitrophota bacterium]